MAKVTTEELMKAASAKQPSANKVKFRAAVIDLTDITLNKVTSPYAIVQYETFDEAGSPSNAWIAAVPVVKQVGDTVIVRETRGKGADRTEQLSVYMRKTTK